MTEFTSGGLLKVIGRYVSVLKNGRFSVMALAFAAMVFPHFAFIGGSPAIYITGFDMTEQMFGIYFGANALGFMLGSFSCTRLGGGIKPLNILYASLGVIFCAGMVMLYFGGSSPLTVALPMFCITFAIGFSRPVANNLILDEVDTDIGAASSVMTFEMFMVGAISMEVIALEWDSKVVVLAFLALIGALIPTLSLLALGRRKIRAA